jgi:hypothetical protein
MVGTSAALGPSSPLENDRALGGDKGVLIAHVLVAEGALASETWMMGDRSHDIVDAKKNGLRAAGALWGYRRVNTAGNSPSAPGEVRLPGPAGRRGCRMKGRDRAIAAGMRDGPCLAPGLDGQSGSSAQ